MKEKIEFYLITGVLLFLGFISSNLPRMVLRNKFGRMIGWFLRNADKNRRNITLENIRIALPELSNDEHSKIMKESYDNLGITLAELLAFPSFTKEDFAKYIHFANNELIEEVFSRKKGLILLSGHFGNWELVAYCVSLFNNIPVTVIVKPQKNHIADKFLNEYRSKGGNKLVSMYNAKRALINVVKTKEALALLADQSANESVDIYVNFFGRPALTFTTPAALALRFDVPIILGFAVRQADCSYEVHLQELKFDDLKSDEEGIKELTQKHAKILENAIRENPHLWAWQHRRWKHQPKAQNVG